MNRMYVDVIKDLEDEYNEELDANFDAGANGLCYDTHCHPECFCFDNLESVVKEQLETQLRLRSELMASMKSLYDGEVNAGVYCPRCDSPAGQQLGCEEHI